MPADSRPRKFLHCKGIAGKIPKSWAVHGWERPHPSGLPRWLTPRWSLPTHVLPEAKPSTSPLLTRNRTRPVARPKGEQP